MAMSDTAPGSARSIRSLMTLVLAEPASALSLSACELDLLLRVMRRARLLGWLAARLDRAGRLDDLPDAAARQLTSMLIAVEARARIATWELDRIAWALADAPDLEVIVLKGCAYLMRGLPNAPGRYFIDVDLMVAERDLDRIEAVLSRRGWQSEELSDYDDRFYRAWSHELPPMVHEEREVEVDIHHNIRGRYAAIRPEVSLMLAAAIPLEGSRFRVLNDTDLVLHAMTNLMLADDLADGVRDLVDIDLLLRHFGGRDADFWPQLVQRARQLGLGVPAYYSLRYAVRFLGTPVPLATIPALEELAPSALTVWLMDRLVPDALFPPHPDRPDKRAAAARFLLYLRSHWLSMPPAMLLRHLSYKFYLRHLRWRLPGKKAEPGAA